MLLELSELPAHLEHGEAFLVRHDPDGHRLYRQGPWRGLDDVEFATMSYVDWFNHRRLHGTITGGPGHTTPATFEADYYRQTTPALQAVTQ